MNIIPIITIVVAIAAVAINIVLRQRLRKMLEMAKSRANEILLKAIDATNYHEKINVEHHRNWEPLVSVEKKFRKIRDKVAVIYVLRQGIWKQLVHGNFLTMGDHYWIAFEDTEPAPATQ